MNVKPRGGAGKFDRVYQTRHALRVFQVSPNKTPTHCPFDWEIDIRKSKE